MLVGLQGAGKTTNGAKLAGLMKRQNGKRPLLAACDIYRPAAIKQLEVVGGQLDIPVFQMGQTDPVDIARAAIEHARQHGNDMVFLDTAGRLHVDEELMDELKRIKAAVEPTEILLVVDAMIGQDAVNAAKAFDDALDIDGVMLTKLDGDARGGAALSIKAVTGKPIKFVGVGEKLDQIEVFHPDRMASRILGMGDMLSLIEKAEQNFDRQKALEFQEKLRKNKFTLTDFYEQMAQLKNMGSLSEIAGMLPRRQGLRSGGGLHGRVPAGADGGHHPFHDPPMSGRKSQCAQLQPQAAHRRRVRHPGGGHQPAAEAVRDDAGHDQAVRRRQDAQVHAPPDGQKGRQGACWAARCLASPSDSPDGGKEHGP